MTEEVVRHVFEPFFTTKPERQGTGLGLATVYGIVSRSGGGIIVRSAVGQGTSFTICLPLHVSSPTAPVEKKAEPEPSAAGKESVLVVEDEEIVLNLVCRILSAQGYDVAAAVDPQEAFPILESREPAPDLILTDIIMPGMNGIVRTHRRRVRADRRTPARGPIHPEALPPRRPPAQGARNPRRTARKRLSGRRRDAALNPIPAFSTSAACGKKSPLLAARRRRGSKWTWSVPGRPAY
jgi:hypothetical protein